MKYYFLIFIISIAGFIGFIYMNKDNSTGIIKASKFTENPNINIGDLFNTKFGNHKWKSGKNRFGQPAVLFSGIALKQDSLRLNGANINFLFTINRDSGSFKTDSVWWSYPETYLDKKRTEIGCFNIEKLTRSLKHLYSKPENLLVLNNQRWYSCKNENLTNLLSTDDLRQITAKLIATCPLSVLDKGTWQISSISENWENIGWPKGEKYFSFTPQVQQEIKNLLRYNFNLNSKLAYLYGNHPLAHQDSIKIFF